MSSFLEALNEVLLRPEGKQPDAGALGITRAWAHGLLLRLLQRFEAAESDGSEAIVERHRRLAAGQLRRWADDDLVVSFCRTLAALLVEHGMASAGDTRLLHLVETGLARELELGDKLESHVATVALDRLRKLAHERHDLSPIRRYAVELGLQRELAGTYELTILGRTYLQLTGRERLRWLLNLEALQSTGRLDEWRLSPDAAAEVSRQLPLTIYWGEGWGLGVSDATLGRLMKLGLIVAQDDVPEADRSTCDLTPLGRELLGEIARGDRTALSVMARALLDDRTLSLGPASVTTQRAAAGEAVARQARLVAHELNNALVPVKTALGRLYKEVKLKPVDEVLSIVRPPVDRGLEAAFEFIRGLTDVSRLVAAPRQLFEVGPAISDAVAEAAKTAGVRVEVDLAEALPPLDAHRHLFVQALMNLVRNAVQATEGRTPRRVIVSAAPQLEGRSVRVHVDDDGPGVPPERRTMIFQDGVSHTAGGLGLGLGLVRGLVDELGGTVECQTSELGGARFVMTLPAAGVD